MKYIATLVFAALLNSAAFAQFGINATYRSNDAPDWEYAKGSSTQSLLSETTAAIGLDYWIPLKAYRIDFLPELNFQQLSNTVEVSNIIRQFDAQLDNTWLSLFLNTNIYFLDLEGDCDCPTFSKSGGLLQKGLFLQLSPGATWMRNKVEAEGQKADSNDITFSGAAGLGLDIGLSDLITLTPLAGFRYYLPAQWESLAELSNFSDILDGGGVKSRESSIRQFYAGLRLGLRLNP